MTVIAIDPGSTNSGVVSWSGERVLACGILPNNEVIPWVADQLRAITHGEASVGVEMIASYGMAVGAEVFDTCVWIGRFRQQLDDMGVPNDPVFRGDVKVHLCGTKRAKDPNVRQALIDRLGKPGTKKNPGPLFGISSHKWAALAVAVTYWDKLHNIQ